MEEDLISYFVKNNEEYGLWIINGNAYTANLTNVHAVVSKRADYPVMVSYRRVSEPKTEWTIPISRFLEKAIVGVCIPINQTAP